MGGGKSEHPPPKFLHFSAWRRKKRALRGAKIWADKFQRLRAAIRVPSAIGRRSEERDANSDAPSREARGSRGELSPQDEFPRKREVQRLNSWRAQEQVRPNFCHFFISLCFMFMFLKAVAMEVVIRGIPTIFAEDFRNTTVKNRSIQKQRRLLT
jgi:hypothetical protein